MSENVDVELFFPVTFTTKALITIKRNLVICVNKNFFGFTAPVVVTTATQQVPFTPGPQMQQTNMYPNQMPYPMGQQGYAMPMPAANPQR